MQKRAHGCNACTSLDECLRVYMLRRLFAFAHLSPSPHPARAMDEWDLDLPEETLVASDFKSDANVCKPKAKTNEKSGKDKQTRNEKVAKDKQTQEEPRKRKATPMETPDLKLTKPVVAPTFNEELGCPDRLFIGVDCAGMLPEALALDELKRKYKIKFASEMDPAKRKLIAHLHGSKFRIFDTVEARVSNKVHNCHMQTAGFPCQPFSASGKHGGFNEERGIVIMDIIKGLDTFRPRLLIFENVQGLVIHHSEEFKAPNDSSLWFNAFRTRIWDSVAREGA